MKRRFYATGFCPKCGHGFAFYTSKDETNAFYCGDCNSYCNVEDVKKMNSDLCEITATITKHSYEKLSAEFLELSDKYDCCFLGFDEWANMLDFGWEKYPETNKLISFYKELNELLDLK